MPVQFLLRIIHMPLQHWPQCNWANMCILKNHLTHDIYEARILTEAAKKYKVVTQMGNQGGSGDGVRQNKGNV